MILELCAPGSLIYAETDPQPVQMEQRVPDATLAKIQSDDMWSSSKIITGLAVNRAASAASMSAMEGFYVNGMGTTMTHSESGTDANGGQYTKKCFLWTGASVDVCYTQRDDSATSGSWKVADFENMLNTVHSNLMQDHPFCGEDKWEDNHYAIDSQTADTSSIVDYVNEKNPFHYCESDMRGTSLHYVWDPTGWGIQLDLRFSAAPSDCESSSSWSRRVDGGHVAGGEHTNPACTDTRSKCKTLTSSSSSWLSSHWWILVAAGGALLLILVCGCIYCRKKEAALSWQEEHADRLAQAERDRGLHEPLKRDEESVDI